MYSDIGRPSIPPEQLLRALLLQCLYSVRSERLLIEQLDYNLLLRWFVGWSMAAPVWNHSTFSKNRERLLEQDIAAAFFAAIVRRATAAGLLLDEHFTIDGTLLEAWASQKSLQRNDRPSAPRDPDDSGNPSVNFRGETRRNDTHASTTDPDARLFKKTLGAEARLEYLAHVLMENRLGLIVDATVTPATGTAERDAALYLVSRRPGRQRLTLGADKGYDMRGFVAEMRHQGYAISQRKRKEVEQSFGWIKTIALLRKLRHRGGAKVAWIFTFAAAAYNLVRLRGVLAATHA